MAVYWNCNEKYPSWCYFLHDLVLVVLWWNCPPGKMHLLYWNLISNYLSWISYWHFQCVGAIFSFLPGCFCVFRGEDPEVGQWWLGLYFPFREWQMERSFQTALWLLQPDIVFILGDVFDEGKWSLPQVWHQQLSYFKKWGFLEGNGWQKKAD